MQQQIDDIFSRYTGQRGELIPILQDLQDTLGYIPPESIKSVANFLSVAESVVYGVITFYTQFYLTRQGKHRVKICQGAACHVRGAPKILQSVERRVGIGPGETSEDYQYSLEGVACFGSCALAPVMVVGDDVHGRMTSRKAEKILGELE